MYTNIQTYKKKFFLKKSSYVYSIHFDRFLAEMCSYPILSLGLNVFVPYTQFGLKKAHVYVPVRLYCVRTG